MVYLLINMIDMINVTCSWFILACLRVWPRGSPCHSVAIEKWRLCWAVCCLSFLIFRLIFYKSDKLFIAVTLILNFISFH